MAGLPERRARRRSGPAVAGREHAAVAGPRPVRRLSAPEQATSAPSVVRRLTSSAALALADLAALFEDLQTSLLGCERLMVERRPGDGPADELTLEAFWTTAVLSSARCCTPGPRGVGLTEEDITATGLAGDVLG